VEKVVGGLDLGRFMQGYSDEGGLAYHPGLMISVWLYAYAVGVTSSRRLEMQIRESLPYMYLAGGLRPDYWALNDFRKQHATAIQEIFTQVLEVMGRGGMVRMGHVAIDSTRLLANAASEGVDSEKRLQKLRERWERDIERWQKRCDEEDHKESMATEVSREQRDRILGELEKLRRREERLQESGKEKLSPTDPEARFMKDRGKFVLGYTATAAVSENHVIVGIQVTQAPNDNGLLVPMVQEVERQTGQRPDKVSADAGFFSLGNLEEMERRGIDAYVPDSNLARELNRGQLCGQESQSSQARHGHMRQKLRSPAGRAVYGKRKGMIEPVFGVLKEQRGMRRLRRRGHTAAVTEFTLAAIAYNLTRMHVWRLAGTP